MEERLRTLFHSWWQIIKKRPYTTGIVIFLAVLIFIFLAYWFGWDWAGFIPYSVNVTTNATKTTQPTNITVTLPYKTLYDWLQLLGILAIPVVVGFGAAWYTRTQQLRDQEHERFQRERDKEAAKKQHDSDQQLADQRAERERKAAERQAELERDLTRDNQQEAALQAYIDKMAALVLIDNLRKSEPGDEKRTIARVRTTTVVRGLDPKRKGAVLRFVQECGLIERNNPIIELSLANLSGANLRGFDLRGVALVGANFWKADLRYANLREADLRSASLDNTDLRHANLREADLSLVYIDQTTFIITTLIGADLREADLSGADLSRADLCGADLHNAIYNREYIQMGSIEPTRWQGAMYNTKSIQRKDVLGNPFTINPTQLPQGFDPQSEGLICVDC